MQPVVFYFTIWRSVQHSVPVLLIYVNWDKLYAHLGRPSTCHLSQNDCGGTKVIKFIFNNCLHWSQVHFVTRKYTEIARSLQKVSLRYRSTIIIVPFVYLTFVLRSHNASVNINQSKLFPRWIKVDSKTSTLFRRRESNVDPVCIFNRFSTSGKRLKSSKITSF